MKGFWTLSWLVFSVALPRSLATEVPIASDDATRTSESVYSLNEGGDAASFDDDDEDTATYAIKNTTSTPNKNSITDGIVWELGYDNFESIIGNSSYTFVLAYDRMDVESMKQRTLAMEKLAESFAAMKQPSSILFRNLKLSFAKLDIRRHSYINYIYKPNGADRAWNEFYYEAHNSETFMRENDIFLPSNFSLFYGATYNVLEFVEEDEEVPIEIDTYVEELRDFLLDEIRNSIHYAMEGVNKPRLPFMESKYGPEPSMMSRISIEMGLKERAKSRDNTFNFSNYDLEDSEDSSNETAPSMSPDLLSYHVKHEETGEKYYRYQAEEAIEQLWSPSLMDGFKNLLQRYLTWAEGYEVLWDDDRKRLEDEQTNYGHYLDIMNEQVKDLLFSVFDDIAEDSFIEDEDVPQLSNFFSQMIFGYGRHPSSLEKYLQQEVFAKVEGPDGATNLNSTHMKQIALFQSIRDLMAAREAADEGKEDGKYEMYFKSMFVKMFAILAEFQENLTKYYLSYREENNISSGGPYAFKSMDVLNMEDPANKDLLSNYDEFESRYTKKGIPVVLSNVNMTDETYTVDYLVEKCGPMDVTRKVHTSHKVGDTRVDKWGGLTGFELPRELITESRIKEDDYDKTISFEQFITLSKKIKNLYLHDYTLKNACDSLFYDKTPYDKDQHFRIPAVIGKYDLFQKLAKSGYQRSWPSLFVGLKGSNSKVHVDSGATGFFMYLVSGRKRWIVYEHSVRPFLYERIDDPSFIADVLALNMNNETNIHMDQSYPLLQRSMEGGYEFIQEAGQLVFIPPNSPHAVENLDDIVGISMNYAPRAGVPRHLHELITGRSPSFHTIEIILRYLMFEGGRDTLAETKDPLYATLGEYEAQL